MLTFNPKVSRVKLVHPTFADRREVSRLKSYLALEKERHGASRAVLHVLTEGPVDDERFKIEGVLPLPGDKRGEIAVFGFNDDTRHFPVSDDVLRQERAYVGRLLGEQRRSVVPSQFDIVPLHTMELSARYPVVTELERLYAATYLDYPVSLDAGSILQLFGGSIAYAVIEHGEIASVLFGDIQPFEHVHVLELTHSATLASARGSGMTVALAMKIREEAERRFGTVTLFAETICGPVMRSCHDFGMSHRGVLPGHTRIVIGDHVFTDFHLWSL